MSAGVFKAVQSGLLFAAYPLLIYLLLSHQLGWIGALLVLVMLLWRLQQHEHWLGLSVALLIVALLALRLFGSDAMLKLSPLLIHSSLLTIFLRSLRDTPMIERFARLEFEQLPPGIATYCRKLTLLWSAFFAANIIGCLWLAMWGSDAAWAIYNGLIVYVLIATLLLANTSGDGWHSRIWTSRR